MTRIDEVSRWGDPQAAFAQLGGMVLGAQPLPEVLSRVAELASEVLPHAVDVSVTLLADPALEGAEPVALLPADGSRAGRGARSARSVAFRGGLAVHLDERQYQAGFGPCMDAALTGQTITVDTGQDTRYPDFSAAAHRRGVGHTVSLPLPIPQHTIGALNIYGGAEPFRQRELELAATFAGYAGVALANAALFASTAELVGNLEAAMASRAVIEQAKGVVMAREHCTADQAFEILRAMSQHQNVKVRALCRAIVATVSASG
jgi:GAF domain-containing protein